MLQFRGSTITSDAGLLAYRELDDTLKLTDTAADKLADARIGKNGRHRLAGPLRQSVFGRLAGYEDVNDAEWLCRDPAMRWVAGEKAITGYAPRPAKWGVSKRNGSADPRTLLLSPICPVSGLTRCAGNERRRPSCSTWIRVKARLTASRKVVPTMATLPAPVIIHCSCSTSSAMSSGARCGRAMCIAPMQMAERAPPPGRVKEFVCIIGRRGGKDSMASAICAYLAIFG